MATDDRKIYIKIVVNKSTNRVVFVDSGGDFVDVLLSFLTLSLGAIIRLTRKQLSIGSLSQIYESIESLDSRYFLSDTCKFLFLRPKNPATKPCGGLKIDIEDGKPNRCYFCRPFDTPNNSYNCLWNNSSRIDSLHYYNVRDYWNVGIFVKEGSGFMITDDCIITQASTEAATAVLKKLSITDVSCLEEKEVHATGSQILRLLSRCFVSDTPLTDVFLEPEKGHLITNPYKARLQGQKRKPSSAQESLSGTSDQKIKVRVLFDELNKRVLHAEANQDFVDLLFTFLSFPIGSVLNRIGRQFSFGCINNLYMSIETLSLANLFISNEIKDGLISPKLSPLPPFGGLKNQLILQKTPSERYCICINLELSKHSKFGCGKEGGFLKNTTTFIVSDGLVVKPFSLFSAVSCSYNRAARGVDVEIGIEEALELLRAATTSDKVLTNAFASKFLKKGQQPDVHLVKRENLS